MVVLPIWAVVSAPVKLSFVAMLTRAASPDDRPSSAADNLLVVVNALFISTGTVANLAFEAIGLDLHVVATVAVLAVVLLSGGTPGSSCWGTARSPTWWACSRPPR